MRRTKEDAAATRERVLDAALRVFSRKGYTATTLADAALTRGAVYWHFKGKAALYTALIQERTAPLGAVFTEALSPDGRCSPIT
jgi:TetR/AcrR family acrAB operon transcriptional repressor